MLGLTSLGIVHTVISLVAVGAGLVAFLRYREITTGTRAGRIYFWTTIATCLTGFGIFQRGGFGPPHILGILTLLVLAIAWAAEKRHIFGSASRYVAVIGYSLTFFFHMIPGFTETTSRLPVGRPLTSGPDDPALQAAVGVAFLVFLIGALLQFLRLRRAGSRVSGAAPTPQV